ncbi:MAG: family 1 glycosylhydrolase [Actinomyces sp.]|nr:family 1 glycosylhydrolase [Actinomyces sp.]
MSELEFGDGFIWGASTAAHQVEGNNVSSDWWRREQAGDAAISEPSGDAADSYHRFAEDIRILASLGLRMYRFSVEWARIEPERGAYSKAELFHYMRMIACCRENNVVPMITLHHFTNPHWFTEAGGWLADDAIECFERYVDFLRPLLGMAEWVCTINEPNMVAMTHVRDDRELTAGPMREPDGEISERLVIAHRRCREHLTEFPSIRSGWAVATQAFHAVPGAEREMKEYEYPRENFFLEAGEGDDFLGVQAYLRTFIGKEGPLPVPEGAETTLTGWEYFPEALELGVRNAWSCSKGTPIFVTENGIATANDQRRIDYTSTALAGLHKCIQDGIKVFGYLHWSLLDNYEWGSYRPTFGLVSWDPSTFERRIKRSGEWFGSVARRGVLQFPA